MRNVKSSTKYSGALTEGKWSTKRLGVSTSLRKSFRILQINIVVHLF